MPHDPTSRELAAPQLTNWRLLKGSHEFPGPDGGTCINEAAIVAAGLPYRKILDEQDCPPCFSRPLAAYALGLNDAMPDDVRPRLMAFVLRLSGSADSAAVEVRRAEYIVTQTVKRVLPLSLRAIGATAEADRCEAVETIGEAANAADAVGVAWAADMAWAADEAISVTAGVAADADAAATAWATALAAACAPREVGAAWLAAKLEHADIWTVAIEILDGALRIGRQAPEIDVALAQARLDAAMATRETTDAV